MQLVVDGFPWFSMVFGWFLVVFGGFWWYILHITNVEQNVLCGEMWRNLSCGEMFPHDRLLHMNQLTFFCCKISFVAIYDVLSRNLFCCDLRAFVWRKSEPQIVLVEEKRQISGMMMCGYDVVMMR